MKKYNIILINLLFIFLLSNCNINKKTEEKIKYVVIEYVDTEFLIYDVKPNLFKLLDSIIISVNNCQLLKKVKFIYCFSVYEYDSTERINIEIINPEEIYCANIDAIFMYKNLIFTYSGKFLDNFFVNKNKRIKYKCKKTDIFLNDINDEYYAYWNYLLKGETIKCIEYNICLNYWGDTNYFKIE